MSLFTGAALLGAGLAAAGGSAVGSIMSAGKSATAAQQGADKQLQASREALRYTAAAKAQDRADAYAAQRASYGQYVARENRYAPYRASGEAANQTMAYLLGLPQVNVAAPPPLPEYLKQTTFAPLVTT